MVQVVEEFVRFVEPENENCYYLFHSQKIQSLHSVVEFVGELFSQRLVFMELCSLTFTVELFTGELFVVNVVSLLFEVEMPFILSKTDCIDEPMLTIRCWVCEDISRKNR